VAVLTRASGIVLTGGASRRMGRDKALLPVGDPPVALARRVADALVAAGCPDIACVGGDLDALVALGLDAVPDDHPGEGPLGGVVTGLRVAAHPMVVVLACDLPRIDGATVRGLIRELQARPTAAAAVPEVDGHRQVHAGAYRRTARAALAAAFDAGERSLTRALAPLEVVAVTHLDPRALVDADHPEDLADG
jgi:molybdopterin-guanine dinucleotide biosynthesis protein A